MGLIEGEGCFHISMQKTRPQFRMPFDIRPTFILYMNYREKNIMDLFKKEIGIGHIYNSTKTIKTQIGLIKPTRYTIDGLKNCNVLINYLGKNNFVGTKKEKYELWKKVVKIIQQDRHRTIKGILEIAKIRDEIHPFKNDTRYRNYDWFKDYLDVHYKDYKPFKRKRKN